MQVSKDVLMMNMDGEFLEEVGAVTKAAGLRKKEVQLNTRMHYTQRRCAHHQWSRLARPPVSGMFEHLATLTPSHPFQQVQLRVCRMTDDRILAIRRMLHALASLIEISWPCTTGIQESLWYSGSFL